MSSWFRSSGLLCSGAASAVLYSAQCLPGNVAYLVVQYLLFWSICPGTPSIPQGHIKCSAVILAVLAAADAMSDPMLSTYWKLRWLTDRDTEEVVLREGECGSTNEFGVGVDPSLWFVGPANKVLLRDGVEPPTTATATFSAAAGATTLDDFLALWECEQGCRSRYRSRCRTGCRSPILSQSVPGIVGATIETVSHRGRKPRLLALLLIWREGLAQSEVRERVWFGRDQQQRYTSKMCGCKPRWPLLLRLFHSLP